MNSLLCVLIFTGLAFATPTNYAAKVVRVVDGDTLKVMIEGRIVSVRLIGVDTPESKANKKAKKDAARSSQDIKTMVSLGKAAVGFTKSIVNPGDIVDIEQDVQPHDRYGRLLAYVYLKSGKMLNEEIIAAGFASVMTIPPNVRHQERFLRAYRAAREERRGLWAAP